ncbi:Serine/threonine-protein kinase tnni3k [Tritrichomonas musculus]|uniref:Serine/threonine-protein kinase tnni3k n=1 Tax=Tritrichomonas musculus TaxID=1915356 RepID=A0ABR2HH70_9EUKA
MKTDLDHNRKEGNIEFSPIEEDIITPIIQFFDFKKDGYGIKNLRQLLNLAPRNPINPSIFMNLFENLFEELDKYTSRGPLIVAYKSFLKVNKENNYSELKTGVINEINKFQGDKRYQKIHQLFSLIINNLIDQTKIQLKFQKNQTDENRLQESSNKKQFHDLTDIQNIGDFNAAFKSSFDDDCKFYFKKTYNSNLTSTINQELIKRELEIYKKEFRADKYGSFIVHSTNRIGNNHILIPYFPFMNLHVFLSNMNDKDNFTTIDKVVIIKEIAIGFSELHSQHIYHQNINSNDIFIDNDKNAYIGNFVHDSKLEQHQTKLVQSAYYRHPGLIQNPNELSIENENDDNKARYDIYSFGVLAHEIITTRSPNERFGYATRENRVEQLQNNYFDFLFKDEDDFDAKYGVPGMRDIISRCMSLDEERQYSTFKELIESIDNLRIYKNNEEEIETRIQDSADCNTYECEVSDIITNFYFGNETSKDTISKFIEKCKKLGINENYEFSPIEEDIITPILQFFDFRNKEANYANDMLFFKERFNKMIELNSTGMNAVCNVSLSDNEKKLMKMSMNENNGLNNSKDKKDEEFYDCGEVIMKFNSNIIPITNLEEFEKKESEYICEHLLIYLFFISKELSIIHSRNLYHGEMSTKSIGIYYNTETEAFLPSIIPFYFFFKKSPNAIAIPTTTARNKSSDIDKYQKKDVKRFKEMMRYFDKNIIIPSEIYESETMNEILYKIYNLNIQNKNKEIKNKFEENYENFLHEEYSSFEITLPTIHDIFVCKEKTNKIYQIFDRYLRIDATVSYILQFSNFIISKSVEDETSEKSLNIIEIKEKLIKIKENNNKIFDEILRIENEENHTDYSYEFKETAEKGITFTIKEKQQHKDKNPPETSHYITENGKEGNKPGFQQEDYSQDIKIKNIMRVARFDNKIVRRTLEIATNIKIYSFRFIITRYIFGLNPSCKYRINVKIHQSKDKKIVTVSHIDAMNYISRLGFYPEQNSNNDIIFFVSLNYQPAKPPEKQDKQQKDPNSNN